ncbi:hypothetical protein IFM61606_09965 [Aspergillus udagawae]|nr:hypothetical protein IFM61606_09965 [Aspergillus udagawae]
MFEYPQFPLYYSASEPGPGDELLDYSQLDPREPLESQSHSAITLDTLVSRPATGQVDAVSVSHQSSPGHPPGEVSSSKEERTARSNKATDVLILRLAAEMKDELGNMERRLNNLERRADSLADLVNSLSDLPSRVDHRIDNLSDTVNKESQRISKIVKTVDFITRRFGPLLARLARRPGSSWPVSSRETSTQVREEGAHTRGSRSEHLTAERGSLFTSPEEGE